MPCYKPLKAYVKRGKNGNKSVVSFSPPKSGSSIVSTGKRDQLVSGTHGVLTALPCGQCIGCRLERSRQWAVRLMKEFRLHDKACFLTLTYDDAHLPRLPNGLPTLVLEDVQLFFKRLRKQLSPNPLRFFQCGEYGEETFRPHHHVVLFGEDFGMDRVRVEDSRSGFPQYTSAVLSKSWGNGRCTISEVSFESAAYVARYCLKKVTGKNSDDFYKGRKPEFVTMSRRPGIGSGYFEEYVDEIYAHDEVIPAIGRPPGLPPKYFDRLLEKVDPLLFEKVKKSRKLSLDFFSDPDTTDARLDVRNRCKESLVKNCLKRSV